MSDEEVVVLEDVGGVVEAEILQGLLEAQGIETILSRESAGMNIYPTTFGMLGSVQLLVRKKDLEQARQVMADYHAGKYEDPSYYGAEVDQQPPGE